MQINGVCRADTVAERDVDNTFKWSVAFDLLTGEADRVALGGNLDILAARAGQTSCDNETNVGNRGLEIMAHRLSLQDINQILAPCR